MCPKVKERKTIIIRGSGMAATFRQDINIQFVPDEVILRGICYYDNTNAANSDIYTIKSSLINNEEIATFGRQENNTTFQKMNSSFILRRPVQGSYYFTVIDFVNDEIEGITFTMTLALEFIQYEK